MSDSIFGDATSPAPVAKDAGGFDELARRRQTGKPGVLTPAAEKGLGPYGTIVTDLALGYAEAETGDERQDESARGWAGLGQVLAGGANVAGPTGAVANAFGAGYSLGDHLASTVDDSRAEAIAPHTDDVPDDEA